MWQAVVPTGTLAVSWEPGQHSAFIDPLRPDQRVAESQKFKGEAEEALVGDPVYTYLRPPRQFDSVTVRFWFDDTAGVPILEAGGITASNPAEVYDLQPLENTLIDNSKWPALDENGLMLLQRVPTYTSVADFLAHPPAGNKIATYHYIEGLPGGTQRLLPGLDLDKNKIDFIIARYQTPQRIGNWEVATLTLDPSELLMQNGAWKVALSLPGVTPDGPQVIMHRIDVTFNRAPLHL